MIPYGRQNISQDDIDAVIEVLRSDFLTQGPLVPEFEKVVASFCGAKHAVAVNSATSALHIACLALGVGPGDMVWTSPITFVASANCARYCGADVDFIDIDPDTYNMSMDRLAEKLEQARQQGRLPKVVIPVHLAGQSCDMQQLHALSIRYGFRVIEDASHAIGGSYQGEKIGKCRYSDITVFSFHPVKIITTGEGGMAVTNDSDPPDGSWYYQQIELGFNYRMTDMQAALGISQMRRLDDFVARRHAIAARYEDLLKDTPVIRPWQHPDRHSALHLYIVRLQAGRMKYGHREVFERMRADGIGVNQHYTPIYRHPYYQSMGFRQQDFPEAERYYAEAITLPIYPGLTPEQQDEIVHRLVTPPGYQTIF